MSHLGSLEELDLAIPNMDSGNAEREAASLLKGLPGIDHVRLIERGAYVRYNPERIDHKQICAALQNAGYRASTFQDSESGETGRSSQ
jgi:hypothetical protein